MSTDKRKAVFLDIDGTIITRGKGPFSEDTEAMEESTKKGHLLFLNTGRSFANIPQVLLDFSFLKGIAAGGGAHVLLADPPPAHSRYQTIHHKWIPEHVLAEIFAWYGKHSDYCILEGERDCYIINPSSPLRLAKDPIPVHSLDDLKRKSSGDLITKLTLDGFASDDELLLLGSFFNVNSFPEYSEAIIKGENKGKALELILNTLGVKREDSIAIGDSANDLDMFRSAGLGIVMGSAPAEIKAAAGAVTASCGEGGVAEALKKLVLKQ